MSDEDTRDEIFDSENDVENENEVESPPEVRDEFDDLLDNDPQMREAVKAEMKRRLMQGVDEPRQPQGDRPKTELERVRDELEATQREIDEFFSTPEQERNYEKFEQSKLRLGRLERQERLALEQRDEYRRALSRADSIVDSWIREQAAMDPNVAKYGDRIKRIAKTLRENVRADEATLRDALKVIVEPNAYKEYVRANRQTKRKPQSRRDVPDGNAYMDDDGDDRPARNDKYADASEEERAFLRNVGLLKDERSKRSGKSELIPTEDGGFIIPIGRGRRNESGRES